MASWPFKQKEAELILLLQEVALGAGGTERQSTAAGCSLLTINSCVHTCSPAPTPAKSETAVSTRGYSPPLRANFTAECLGQKPAVPAATTVSKPLNCLERRIQANTEHAFSTAEWLLRPLSFLRPVTKAGKMDR